MWLLGRFLGVMEEGLRLLGFGYGRRVVFKEVVLGFLVFIYFFMEI